MRNLFDSWDELLDRWSTPKKIILFLDYDGTLTPIAESPSQAILSQETKALIERFSNIPLFQVVIISGRRLVDLKHMVGLEGLVYIGNHGWEIEGSTMHFKSLIPIEVSSMMRKIKYE